MCSGAHSDARAVLGRPRTGTPVSVIEPRRLLAFLVILVILGAFTVALCGVAEATVPARNGKLVFTGIEWQEPSVPCGQEEGCMFDTNVAIEAADGFGRRRRRLLSCGRYLSCSSMATAAFAPNGRSIVVAPPTVPWSPGYPEGLVVAGSDGSRPRRLPVHTQQDSEPAWAPDGRRLAFTGSNGETPETSIYTVSSEGQDLRRITSGTDDADPAWSPRGDLIAFTRSARGHTNLFLVATDGSRLRQVTFGGGGNPSWAPDGRKLAVARYRSGAINIDIVATGGATFRRLTFRGATQPAWSPDGKRIAFVRGGGIYTVKTDGRGLRRIVRPKPRHPVRVRGERWYSDTVYGEPAWQPLPLGREPRGRRAAG